MRIFLISGKARNGKDTTGNFIASYLKSKNETFVKTQYGKYIKMYTKELTDWDGNEETKSNYRDFFQEIGTEIIRKKMNKADIFVRRMAEDIEVYDNYVDNVIITDVRFPIEIDYIKGIFPNVYSIRIIRPDFESELNKKQQSHVTEMALSDDQNYDYIIINESLDKLENDVNEMLKGLDKE